MVLKKSLLEWDQTLFKDIEVFDIDYVPDQFQFRESQMQQLAFSVKPALRGGRIIPSLCRGLPGTGKTTSIHKLFDEIEESTKKIVPLIVNCNIDNTEFAIFSRIYTKLTGFSHPASGTALKVLLDMLGKYIAANNIVPLVCLDDANYLVYNKELNNVLYPLMRFHEEYAGVSFGVILIFSDMSISMNSVLDVRVSSVFRYETVEFTPYTPREIAGILDARVKQGLYPKVISGDILDRIVDLTLQSGSDIRLGLDLIRRSALYAENDARTSVTEDDVAKAFEQAKNTYMAGLLNLLSAEEKTILQKIIELTQKKEVVTAKTVRAKLGESAPKTTRFNEILEKLEAVQFISMEYIAVGKARHRKIILRQDPEQILSLMK
ncbi:MAG TPA: ORC1-type DNA replication protein [Methanocorpusculum sp.]|nr:ORC1-type DNA replication protein [Methanocorpusculum sp.]